MKRKMLLSVLTALVFLLSNSLFAYEKGGLEGYKIGAG